MDRLPAELLYDVVEHVKTMDLPRQSHHSKTVLMRGVSAPRLETLTSLSMVSQVIRGVALSFIFHTITIDVGELDDYVYSDDLCANWLHSFRTNSGRTLGLISWVVRISGV